MADSNWVLIFQILATASVMPFIENTKKSVQLFISHLEKVTEEME